MDFAASYQTELVRCHAVTDSTAHVHVPKVYGRKTGRIPRDWHAVPYGALEGAKTFEDAGLKVIPRDEWPDRLIEQEKRRQSLVHLIRAKNTQPLDQDGTNYCWSQGPTMAAQLRRLTSGFGWVDLSPASVAAIIKKGANQGGWGGDAIKLMADRGINSTALWAPNDRNYRKLDTAEAREEAKHYRIPEWVEIEPRNLDQLATMMLLNYAGGVGYNWWGHEVCALRLVYFGGNVKADSNWGGDIFNSWGPSYGDRGIGTLRGNKWLPDDAVFPYSVAS